jgi:hypothetical protein
MLVELNQIPSKVFHPKQRKPERQTACSGFFKAG